MRRTSFQDRVRPGTDLSKAAVGCGARFGQYRARVTPVHQTRRLGIMGGFSCRRAPSSVSTIRSRGERLGFRRAAVAQRQIRGGVSASLRWRQRGPRFDRLLPGLLQRPAPHSSLDGMTPDQAYFTLGSIARQRLTYRRGKSVQTTGATSVAAA